MFPGFVVLFDASVFYPAPVCDVFLELAFKGIFRAKWTDKIHDEWIYNLLKNRPDLKRKQLERRRDNANKAILGCLVDDYESLIDGLDLPDVNDRHVLAAAIKAQAQIIVTYNLKDFPEECLRKFNIDPQHPDDFFLNQMDLSLSVFLSAVKNIRSRLKKPPMDSQRYLNTLRKHALLKTADALQPFSEVI